MDYSNKFIAKLIGSVIGVFFILGTFTVIPTGSRGVVTHFGKVKDGILDEGIHLKLPIISSVEKLSIQVQKTEADAAAASRDIQEVKATFVINWHLSPTSVNKMYQEIGQLYEVNEKIIHPAVQEVLKAATAKRTAEEILTKRLELKQEIDEQLVKRLEQYHVTVNDISITNLSFTTEFNKAVESKQIAEQSAKRAEYVAQQAKNEAVAAVNKAHGEAEAKIEIAKAEAESQRLVRQTITPEILQQRAIEKWNGEFPQVMGSGALPFLNINLKGK